MSISGTFGSISASVLYTVLVMANGGSVVRKTNRATGGCIWRDEKWTIGVTSCRKGISMYLASRHTPTMRTSSLPHSLIVKPIGFLLVKYLRTNASFTTTALGFSPSVLRLPSEQQRNSHRREECLVHECNVR